MNIKKSMYLVLDSRFKQLFPTGEAGVLDR